MQPKLSKSVLQNRNGILSQQGKDQFVQSADLNLLCSVVGVEGL